MNTTPRCIQTIAELLMYSAEDINWDFSEMTDEEQYIVGDAATLKEIEEWARRRIKGGLREILSNSSKQRDTTMKRVMTPFHSDGCGHPRTDYVCSFLHDHPDRSGLRYDVYKTSHGICCRYGDAVDEYCVVWPKDDYYKPGTFGHKVLSLIDACQSMAWED